MLQHLIISAREEMIFVDNQDWHFYGFAAKIILLALKTFTCLTISYFVKGVSFSSYVKT